MAGRVSWRPQCQPIGRWFRSSAIGPAASPSLPAVAEYPHAHEWTPARRGGLLAKWGAHCSFAQPQPLPQAVLVFVPACLGGLLARYRRLSRPQMRLRGRPAEEQTSGNYNFDNSELGAVVANDFAPSSTATLGLAEILIVATLAGLFAGLLFSPAALAVRNMLDPVAREVIKNDMSQWIQNAFTLLGFIFVLLIVATISTLLQRQERLYLAVYDEVTEIRSLVEQLCLMCGDRAAWDGSPLADIEAYISQDLLRVGEPRALPFHPNGEVDPLERLLYTTSVGEPSCLMESVRSLRRARNRRLAAVQRRFPRSHYISLAALGALILVFFVVLGAGVAGFEPPGEEASPGRLLWLLSGLFSLQVASVIMAFAVIYELSAPVTGYYGVYDLVQTFVHDLLHDIRCRKEAIGNRVRDQSSTNEHNDFA